MEAQLAQRPVVSSRAARQRLADELLTAMAAVRRSGRRVSGRPAELGALTGSQLELVRLLRRQPGLSVAVAARELSLASNTVSTLVGELSRAGLVRRETDGADRRVARLDLAEEIRGKVAAWRDRRVVALAAAIGTLSADERRVLAEAAPLLARLSDALDRGAAS